MKQPFWERWVEDLVAVGLAIGGFYLLTDVADWPEHPAMIFSIVMALMTWQRPLRGY